MEKEVGQIANRDRYNAIWLSLSYGWRAAKWQLMMIVAGYGLSAALPIVSVVITERLIESLTQRAVWASLSLIGLQGCVALFASYASMTRTVLDKYYRTKVSNEAAIILTENALVQGPGAMEDPEHYKLFVRARDTVRHGRFGGLAVDVASVTMTLCQTVALFVVIEGISPLIGMLSVVFMMPGAVVLWKVGSRKFNYEKLQARVGFRARYWSGLLTRDTIYDIHGNNLRTFLFGKWSESYIAELRNTLAVERIILGTSAVAASWTSIASMALMATLIVSSKNLALIVAGMQGIRLLFASSTNVGERLRHMEEDAGYAREAAPWLRQPPITRIAPMQQVNLLSVRDLGYCYPTQERWAVRGVSVDVHSGELLAVVGRNGAGKSTLARCLLGQLNPLEGHVEVDGQTLTTAQGWGELSAYTPQHVIALEVSVREYLSVGRELEDEVINNVLSRVQCTELTHFLDEPLGLVLHGGKSLSMGQWQKLNVARIILNEKAKFVVLDEPYASVDPRTEEELLGVYRDLAIGRIVVVVSHRESIARVADRILYMKDGVVCANGSHRDLIGTNLEYAAYWRDSDTAIAN